MGIASMIIGIIAAVLGFIPYCGFFAFLPAGVGFILGVVDVVLKANKNKKLKDGEAKLGLGMGIAGIVLNSVAIIVIILVTVVFAAAVAAAVK